MGESVGFQSELSNNKPAARLQTSIKMRTPPGALLTDDSASTERFEDADRQAETTEPSTNGGNLHTCLRHVNVNCNWALRAFCTCCCMQLKYRGTAFRRETLTVHNLRTGL